MQLCGFPIHIEIGRLLRKDYSNENAQILVQIFKIDLTKLKIILHFNDSLIITAPS